jgi:hypothetical protein
MNKTILVSLALIGVVGVIATGATISFLSDTEKSIGNTLAIGTIDISVAGQNPWNTTYPMLLDKPCQTNYINFTIRNVGANPANVWKRIMNVATDGGDSSYCGASSEPEYTEGGGQFTNGVCNSTGYVEQDNLSAYVVYDMYICDGQVASNDCPIIGDPATGAPDLNAAGNQWKVIISENQQVRIDNVNGVWIKLDGELGVNESFAVSQSYHLMAWDNAGVETITNWAQGDTMTFDIELEARQTSAPAPTGVNDGSLVLENKDSVTWVAKTGDGIGGILTYNTFGPTFNYTLDATVTKNEDYCLIYYPDPWPGDVGGFAIECGITPSAGVISSSGSKDIGSIPISTDANYPASAKLWLVLDADYDETAGKMIGWQHHDDYLFEMNMIKYDKI